MLKLSVLPFIINPLTHFWQMFFFKPPENTRTPVFSGGIKWKYWPEMGYDEYRKMKICYLPSL